VLLLDLNQNDAAKEYIQAAKRGPLYAEEKRLLEDERAKISAASPSPTASSTFTPTPTPRSRSTPEPSASAAATP
jgi:hypothetical protein